MHVVTDPYNLCEPFDGIFPSSIFKTESENNSEYQDLKFNRRAVRSAFNLVENVKFPAQSYNGSVRYIFALCGHTVCCSSL